MKTSDIKINPLLHPGYDPEHTGDPEIDTKAEQIRTGMCRGLPTEPFPSAHGAEALERENYWRRLEGRNLATLSQSGIELREALEKAARDCVNDYYIASGRMIDHEGNDGYGSLRALRLAIEAIDRAALTKALSAAHCTWPNCDQPSGFDYCYHHCFFERGAASAAERLPHGFRRCPIDGNACDCMRRCLISSTAADRGTTP